jgi:uncharacterized protein YjiS (DUF1127 family)
MAQANLHQSSSEAILALAQSRGLCRRFATLIALWQSRAKQRHELRELEAWVLRDLGLSKAEAASEAAKPFWRP